MRKPSLRKHSALMIAVWLLCGITGCESGEDINHSAQVSDTTQADITSTGGDTTTGDTEASGKGGTVQLTFSATNGVKKSPNLKDPLVGVVYGALWKSEDVAVLGPVDGAIDVGGVEVANVDTSGDGPSTAMWTSEPLPPGEYIFLGFFDVDGNGSESKSPDPGDPVTLPFTNKFVIEETKTTPFEVVFELVYN